MKLTAMFAKLKPCVGDRMVCLLAALVVVAGMVELAGQMLLMFK